MSDTGKIILTIVMVIASLIGGYLAGYSDGYYGGQIDAINHRIYYHLERKDDGSSTWAKCPDVCEAK